MNAGFVFGSLAALAAIALIGIITLAGLERPIPEVLTYTVVSIVSAAAGGGAVKSADTINTKLRAMWKGDAGNVG